METPPPNDSSKTSISPPVGGRLRSFSRDWQINNCSSNVLNIITNGYVLPFLSKPNLVRFPLIVSEYKALPKDQALADCIQFLLSKNAIERVENVKSLGFYSHLFLVPKLHQRWRPVIDLSRLNTFLLIEKFKMKTPESIRTSLIPGEWVSSIDLSDAYLHIPIHPLSRKYLRFCHRCSSSLPPLRTCHGPPGFYNDRKRSKAEALSRGLRLHQYLDVWLIRSQSQEEAQVNTQAVVDLTQSLGWIINQEKSELKPTQVFSFVGYEYHLDSALVKPTQERWLKLQDLILRLKSKHVLTAICLMSLIRLLASVEKMVPEGCLHMRPFQFHLKEHWRFPQSLDSLLPWTETISAHLDWWQNPANVMKGADLHLKDHSIQLFTDASNEDWGTHLDQSSTKGLWSEQEKRLHINVLELKVVSLALRQFKDNERKNPRNSSSCHGQLNHGSLHKQTRRNSLSGDVCAPVKDHDMVPSLSHNIESQTHSRLSQCDGRPSVQVQPSSVDRMVTTSTGVQANLSKVVHSSCRPVCHSSEPQTPSIRVSYPRPKGLGYRCSKHKLDGSHCLCLPSNNSPSQGDPKNQAMPLPDHPNSPRLTRDALVLGASAALNRDPTATPSVNNTTQTVPQLRIPQQSATSQPPHLVSRSGQLQEQGFSVEVAERIAAPQRSSTRTVYKSKWALFEKWCREDSVDFSTPSVKQISDFSCTCTKT